MIRIKICGLRCLEDAEAVNQADINDAGFVFAESPRKIDGKQAEYLRRCLRLDIDAVGVFVNEAPEEIIRLVQEEIIQKVQLHGSEDEKYIRYLKSRIACPVLKAVRVKNRAAVFKAQETSADLLLMDTYVKGIPGGSGQVFDLNQLPELTRPWYMAGGLTPENIQFRLSKKIPYGVDVSSGVETNGCKDLNKIKKFAEEVRSFERRIGKGELR